VRRFFNWILDLRIILYGAKCTRLKITLSERLTIVNRNTFVLCISYISVRAFASSNTCL